jgi:hypothetical protein
VVRERAERHWWLKNAGFKLVTGKFIFRSKKIGGSRKLNWWFRNFRPGIQQLRKNSIQTIRDNVDVLRHIIKNVSSRLVGIFQSQDPVTNWELFFPSPKKRVLEKERWTGATEPGKDTEDTTLVQIEEFERGIRVLPFVTKLSPVGSRNSHGHGYQVSLRCPSYEEYGSCGKNQEPPVQVSSSHPTLHACLQVFAGPVKTTAGETWQMR